MTTATVIGVVGAGSMGAGIAQLAAMRGHHVVLADAFAAPLARARAAHEKGMQREVDKGRLDQDAADEALRRISYVEGAASGALGALAGCGVVIEAVIEDLAAKREIFGSLEGVVDANAILATNTSSLSVAALASACTRPERVVGVHFFNPAPVMPLVEIVPAIGTHADVTEAARALVTRWGKTAVTATDTPGFIVNRVARPFYGESLRMLEEGVADCATIDRALRDLGGFRMGPFELMDLIGNDVNFAVTVSVFESMFHDPRYRPSITQQRMVEAGLFGRKSGRGYYAYSADGRPLGADGRPSGASPSAGTHAVGRTSGAVRTPDDPAATARDHAIVNRVVAMLINEAVDAVRLGIATPVDVELAMTRGVNYPKGLLAWGDEIGPATVLATLEALQAEYGEDRYRPSPLLRRVARAGKRLLE